MKGLKHSKVCQTYNCFKTLVYLCSKNSDDICHICLLFSFFPNCIHLAVREKQEACGMCLFSRHRQVRWHSWPLMLPYNGGISCTGEKLLSKVPLRKFQWNQKVFVHLLEQLDLCTAMRTYCVKLKEEIGWLDYTALVNSISILFLLAPLNKDTDHLEK